MADDEQQSPSQTDEGFFISDQDFAFIQGINEEFVEDVVEVLVQLYKMDVDSTESTFRGETTEQGKTFSKTVQLHALVVPEDQRTEQDRGTFDVLRSAQFGVQRERLKDKEFYPQRGDFIEWDEEFFEIQNVVDNELLGSKYFYRHSLVADAERTRDSNIELVQRNRP